jgi:hsp70-interacting protein
MGDDAGVPDSLWKALFEWSIAQQGDGTTSQSTAAPIPDADRKWLEEALAAGVVDLSKQLVEIKAQLEMSLPASATEADIAQDEEHKARLLDELLDLVESIDQAKDLSTIGGLSTLLHVIDRGVPGLQWRAAEVIATCAQNNPEVQASFFRDGVMPAIWGMLSSDDATCRLKALLAMSCMLRGSAEVRGWWSAHDGVGKVLELVAHDEENKRIVRKCLQILNYVAGDPTAQDREQLAEHGAEIEQILVRTISTVDDHDVETAAIELGKSLGLQTLFKNVS